MALRGFGDEKATMAQWARDSHQFGSGFGKWVQDGRLGCGGGSEPEAAEGKRGPTRKAPFRAPPDEGWSFVGEPSWGGWPIGEGCNGVVMHRNSLRSATAVALGGVAPLGGCRS